MSCKGLVELIVLNIGLSAGILDTRVFSMFVVMAVVSTVATTPLTLWAYPKEIRRSVQEFYSDSKSLHSIKAGEKAHGPEDQEDGNAGAFPSKKLLVVLDRFEHLPGLMTLFQLIQPSSSRIRSNMIEENSQLRRRSTIRKGQSSSGETSEADADSIKEGSTEDETSPAALAYSSALNNQQQLILKPELSIDALRLIELTERTSAVMRDAESEDTLRADPILNVFRTFSHLNRIPVTSSMSIVNLEEYSNTVVSRARDSKANLVIVPWSLPRTNVNSGLESTGGVLNAIASPFGNLFGGASNNNDAASTSRPQAHSPHQAQFVRRVFQNSDCDVGLFLERSSDPHRSGSILSMANSNHLMMSFMGGPDDRVALSLAVRLAKSNENLKLTVLMFKRISSDEAGENGLPSVPPTMHHNQSLNPQSNNTIQNNQLTIGGTAIDTMYPKGNKPSPLEASLEDDLALKAVQDEFRESGLLPALDSNSEEGGEQSLLKGDRICFKQILTSRPLKELIHEVEVNQPSLLILGRGRRLPTLTHREELRHLLSSTSSTGGVDPSVASTSATPANLVSEKENRYLNSETCKVVGEPAMALTLAKTFAHTLVIASSMKVRNEQERA